MELDPKDLNIRLIDQRVDSGISGEDIVTRIIHIPSGIVVEVPRLAFSRHNDREIAMDMIIRALNHPLNDNEL